MNNEEIKIKEFDKQQLEILLNDLQDIDKFTGFKDGAFKYELGKYQASLLVNCIKKQKESIDKAVEELKKGLHELDTRRREEVYVEEYIEESIDILKGVE